MRLRSILNEARTVLEDSPDREKLMKAVFAKLPPDSKKKMGGKRKVMFTGDIAHAIGIPDYTSKNLEDLTDNEIRRLAAALKV